MIFLMIMITLLDYNVLSNSEQMSNHDPKSEVTSLASKV